MKRKLSAVIIGIITIFTSVCAYAVDALPTSSPVFINGEEISFDAYSINDNNYFKLRDLAYALSGSDKQFDVGYDSENDAVFIVGGAPYTIVGGEMAPSSYRAAEAAPSHSRLIKNGSDAQAEAYLINDNNYFKLRDIAALLDFGVDWDADRGVIIDTSKGYTPESSAEPADVYRSFNVSGYDIYINSSPPTNGAGGGYGGSRVSDYGGSYDSGVSDDIVYVTNTGTKYHRSTCSSLRKSKIQTTVSEAKALGYTPCSNCHPPQ